jgi:hypothetical protein
MWLCFVANSSAVHAQNASPPQIPPGFSNMRDTVIINGIPSVPPLGNGTNGNSSTGTNHAPPASDPKGDSSNGGLKGDLTDGGLKGDSSNGGLKGDTNNNGE